MSLLGKITSSITTATPLHSFPVSGVGIVEGWRGAIVHRLEVEANAALTDTIVPDFPLANKSFNLSYAGNDSFSLAELVPLLPL
jgi:hypothetical protein